jgi:hypothetical protein
MKFPEMVNNELQVECDPMRYSTTICLTQFSNFPTNLKKPAFKIMKLLFHKARQNEQVVNVHEYASHTQLRQL